MGKYNLTAQRVAVKHVSMVDRVIDVRRTLVPAFTEIRRVDTNETVDFTREKVRDTGAFWAEWNDLTMRHGIGLGLRGECE